MKRLLLMTSLASAFVAVSAMADVTASATTSWDATAARGTTSMLVVTSSNSLTLQHAESLNGFNFQDGMFDVATQGQETATDFRLTAQIISDTLTNASGDTSTLNVGVTWDGTALTNSSGTVLVNSSSALGLESLVADGAYNGVDHVGGQLDLKLTIASVTPDGSTSIMDYSTLPDGYWTGDVKVRLNATWTIPSA